MSEEQTAAAAQMEAGAGDEVKSMPDQDWAVNDERGILEAFNDLVPPVDGEESRREPSGPVEAPKEKSDPEPAKEAATPQTKPEAQQTGDPEKAEEPKAGEDEFFAPKKEDEKAEPEAPDGQFDEAAFDDATEKLSKDMTPKAGERWKQLRQELKEHKVELAKAQSKETLSEATQKKLEELETKAAHAESMQEQFEELRNINARARLESSSKYKSEVIDKVAVVLEQAAELATESDIDPALVQAVIKETNRGRRKEMLKGAEFEALDDQDRAEINLFGSRFTDLVRHRDKLYSEAQTEVEAFKAEQIKRDDEVKAESRNIYKTLQGALWDKYEGQIPGLLDGDGVPTESYERMRKRAMSLDFSTASQKDLSYAGFAGVTIPHLIEQVADLQTQLAKVDHAAGQKARHSAKPSDGEPADPTDQEDKTDGEVGLLEAMRKTRF